MRKMVAGAIALVALIAGCSSAPTEAEMRIAREQRVEDYWSGLGDNARETLCAQIDIKGGADWLAEQFEDTPGAADYFVEQCASL